MKPEYGTQSEPEEIDRANDTRVSGLKKNIRATIFIGIAIVAGAIMLAVLSGQNDGAETQETAKTQAKNQEDLKLEEPEQPPADRSFATFLQRARESGNPQPVIPTRAPESVETAPITPARQPIRQEPAAPAGPQQALSERELKILASPIAAISDSGSGVGLSAGKATPTIQELTNRLLQEQGNATALPPELLAQLQAQAPAAQLAGAAAQAAGKPDPDSRVATAKRNQEFLDTVGKEKNKAPIQIQAPPDMPTLMPGSVLPATLITRINSDLPGMVTAQITQNVYDSIYGRYLMIPRGSRVIGYYSSDIANGQSRVLVSFTTVIFPDGSRVDLQGMTAADSYGQSGMHDMVDTHFWEQFGASFLIAAISDLVGADESYDNGSNGVTVISARDPVSGATGEALQDVSQAMLEKYQNIRPTLIISQGYQFNIMVNRPIQLPGGYTSNTTKLRAAQ